MGKQVLKAYSLLKRKWQCVTYYRTIVVRKVELSIMNTSHLVFKLPAVYEGTIFQIKKRIEICRPPWAHVDQLNWTK